MKTSVKKKISPLISTTILLGIFILSLGIIFCAQNFAEPSLIKYKLEKKTTLLFVGDIMLDRGVEWQINKYEKGDFKFPFIKVADELSKADILFGNLESQISDQGYNVGSIYSFRANPKAIEGLKYAGFDVLSLANNHAFDYTGTALRDSMNRLKENNINFVGAGADSTEAYSPLIKQVNGIEIAFLAFADFQIKNWEAKENMIGMALLSEENLKKGITLARKQANFIIVSLHFGDEYKTEANDRQKYFSQLAINEGANLVIGHHPHVAEPVEKYKNGWIAYSLGNFVFDQSFSEETMRGKMLKVILSGKQIRKVIPIDIKINSAFQPEIENQNEQF